MSILRAPSGPALALIATLSLPFSAMAQPQTPAWQHVTFRTTASLVIVPAIVTDRRGSMVTGLPQEAFNVLDDGVPQPISCFVDEETPVSIGIVFDTSGSMKDILKELTEEHRGLNLLGTLTARSGGMQFIIRKEPGMKAHSRAGYRVIESSQTE